MDDNDYIFLSGDHPEYGPGESGLVEFIQGGQIDKRDGYTGRYRGTAKVSRTVVVTLAIDGVRASMIGDVNGRYEVRALQRIGPDWDEKTVKVPHAVMCCRFSSKSRARRLIRAYQSLGIPSRLYRWRRV